MSIQQELIARSDAKCELCGAEKDLSAYLIPPANLETVDESILLCAHCREQVEQPDKVDYNHWRCLNDSMWSTIPAVQVMAWRMLNRIKDQGWPQELLDMLYLDEDTLKWAAATGEDQNAEDKMRWLDCNGAELQAGDTVVLTKDLPVKGTGFVAKRGTAVRNIALAADDPSHIEGKVNGQLIYIVTKYIKKS